MDLIERVKNIILQPKTEWQTIDGEQTSTGQLYTGYIIPLVAIGAIASLIGYSLVGVMFFGRMPISIGLSMAVMSFVMGLLAVFLLALIINVLAPTFGGKPDATQALKVAAYSYTPAWVAGLLNVVPALGMLGILAAFYGFYLLYLGLQTVMKAPEEKALPYTVVTIIAAIVMSVILGAITGMIGSSMMGGAMGGAMGGMMSGAVLDKVAKSSGGTTGDANAALGKLKEMGERAKAANEKMEAAQKSGDPAAQMQAAAAAMGALAGGDSNVEPIDHKELKTLLPETLNGMKRTALSSEKTGMAGFNVSIAQADYEDEQGRSIQLSINDSASAKAIMAIAGFGMMESDRETPDGYEKMGKANGRYFKEQYSKTTQSADYTTIVGERFMVEAHGRSVDMATLKSALAKLDLGKLEAMKNQGVKK